MNARVAEALSEIYILTNMILSELLFSIREHISCMHKLAESIAVLDMIASFAHISTVSNFVRPEFNDTVAIKQGRHPILDKILARGSVVPNDTFASDGNNFTIITGPNMSGKSTYLKQIALLQVMAQMGSFVPATYASLRLSDQIFARIGTEDDIESNSSTFTVEMKEVHYILKNATDKSLIIIDELGRGTSIEKGVGICYSICEHLLQIKAFTFFATHFIALCRLESWYPAVRNSHLEVQRLQMENPNLIFSHTLSKGKTQNMNYGLILANKSSLPKSIIEEATAIYGQIKPDEEENITDISSKKAFKKKATFQLGTRLLQVAQHSHLDEASLKVYLQGLKQQFLNDIERTCA